MPGECNAGPFLLVLTVVLCIQSVGMTDNVVPGTLCQADERVWFSCPVQDGTHIVSLCGAPHLTAQAGYLQYRFGRPGQMEWTFPAQRHNTQQQFRHAHYARYQVERMTISFDREGRTYTLFDAYEGDTTPRVRQQGVQITSPGAPARTFWCQGAALGNLHQLTTVVPCDPTDALTMGACR